MYIRGFKKKKHNQQIVLQQVHMTQSRITLSSFLQLSAKRCAVQNMILLAFVGSKFLTFSKHLSSKVSAFCRLSRLWSCVSITSKIPSRKRGMKLSKSTFSILSTKLVQPKQSCRIIGFLYFILLASSSTKLPTHNLSWWCEVMSFNLSRGCTRKLWNFHTRNTTSWIVGCTWFYPYTPLYVNRRGPTFSQCLVKICSKGTNRIHEHDDTSHDGSKLNRTE